MKSRFSSRLALASMTSAFALIAMPGAALAQDNESDASAEEQVGVAEIIVREASELVGRTIAESGLRDRDITVLTLHRGPDVIPNPREYRELEANDRLLCFGRLESMRDMIPARRRRRARVRQLPEDPLP